MPDHKSRSEARLLEQVSLGSARPPLLGVQSRFTPLPLLPQPSMPITDAASYFLAIYLALSSSRIPILASFKPDVNHLIGAALPLPVGDVFDLSHLSTILHSPTVEAHELRIEEYRAEERLRWAVYDADEALAVKGRDGRKLEVGDRVRNVQAEEDEMGCWSVGMQYGGMAGTWGGLDPVSEY